MARFYNPGTLIDETLQYTHPTRDPREGNTLSYYRIRAEEKEFFDVPSSLTLVTDEGEVTVAVNFPKRVKALHQTRGVILVDANLQNISEDDNAASDDKEAKRKGAAMWKEYLKGIITEHYTAVAEIKQSGGVPRAARGMTAYALKALNYDDPGDQVDTISRAKESQTENKALEDKIAALTATVNQLLGATQSKAGA